MYDTSTATAPMETIVTDSHSRLVPAASAAILGAVLIFAAGFAHTAGFTEANVLHNAAHDARHSAGFPCH
uniref:Cobalt transporter subunit CbtB n=1 Tax=Candidatus Kentrum sp. DK TaxID=2126562 RepID=A0A450T170_9GAMM|nr:MAG: cobalt transporter subunit CbtB [Candidatus Kentron sp. DK]VFJ65066.1 MAG: cobalt transporter subunit CbtB [Candidatus Kentron sp. DK]